MQLIFRQTLKLQLIAISWQQDSHRRHHHHLQGLQLEFHFL